MIAYLLGPGAKLYETAPEQFTNRVETTGLYWHFVDLVWIFLFPLFYLLGALGCTATSCPSAPT